MATDKHDAAQASTPAEIKMTPRWEYEIPNAEGEWVEITEAYVAQCQAKGWKVRPAAATEAPQGAEAEPVARVEKHTGSLGDMAIIVWLKDQPPEGTLLYTQASSSEARDALAAERDAALAQVAQLREAVRISRGNVASLGPAGALQPFYCYREWLAMLDAALAGGAQTEGAR